MSRPPRPRDLSKAGNILDLEFARTVHKTSFRDLQNILTNICCEFGDVRIFVEELLSPEKQGRIIRHEGHKYCTDQTIEPDLEGGDWTGLKVVALDGMSVRGRSL